MLPVPSACHDDAGHSAVIVAVELSKPGLRSVNSPYFVSVPALARVCAISGWWGNCCRPALWRAGLGAGRACCWRGRPSQTGAACAAGGRAPLPRVQANLAGPPGARRRLPAMCRCSKACAPAWPQRVRTLPSRLPSRLPPAPRAVSRVRPGAWRGCWRAPVPGAAAWRWRVPGWGRALPPGCRAS